MKNTLGCLEGKTVLLSNRDTGLLFGKLIGADHTHFYLAPAVSFIAFAGNGADTLSEIVRGNYGYITPVKNDFYESISILRSRTPRIIAHSFDMSSAAIQYPADEIIANIKRIQGKYK